MFQQGKMDCFDINHKYWKIMGVSLTKNPSYLRRMYSGIVIFLVILFYDLLVTINFYFLPRQMDVFIEELIFYFTEINVLAKSLTFYFMKDKIMKVFETLESDLFKTGDIAEQKIMNKANLFNRRYWKIVAAVSYTSHLTHIFSPLLAHIFGGIPLPLPLCSYSFLSEEFKTKNIYLLYFYQCIGMHLAMLYNLNTDTFILGLIIFIKAKLDILNRRFRNITDENKRGPTENEDENKHVLKLNQCIIEYDDLIKFCSLVEDIFSVALFVTFSVASGIICVVLFRFTLPAPRQYLIFLFTYMFIMVIQILVPSWYGTQVMDKSVKLSMAVYNCDWTPRSMTFKRNLRIFVERANRPLSITGWKMFPLSLTTFTSIMNTSYSFFTLLRHMQTR